MASKPKLYYFNLPAFGEALRYILHYGNIDFEDIRYESHTEFAAKEKKSFPYGQVPVLEIDGTIIHQTKAMCRYLARKTNLIGKTEWDALQIDIMVDTIDDFRAAMSSFTYEKHDEAKAQKREEAMSTKIPYYLNKFEEHLAANGGHFVNGQVTWADIFFCSMVEYYKFMGGADLLDGKTNLNALINKINNLPQIKKYLENRPTPMKL